MKKDILDNVYYRLKDEHEVKLSILYCVLYADFPISDTEIKHFMLTATSVSFVDLCINLSSLTDEGFLKIVWRDDIEKYELTEQGRELVTMFSDKILLTIRESLRKTIDEYFDRNPDTLKVSAKISPGGGDCFNVELVIKNSKNCLLNLSVFAGDRKTAIDMRKHFEKNASDVLAKVMEIATSFPKTKEE